MDISNIRIFGCPCNLLHTKTVAGVIFYAYICFWNDSQFGRWPEVLWHSIRLDGLFAVYCFGGIETLRCEILGTRFHESKFYCFGGIETNASIISLTFLNESKFYCFGGIETLRRTPYAGKPEQNLNSTASAVLRRITYDGVDCTIF